MRRHGALTALVMLLCAVPASAAAAQQMSASPFLDDARRNAERYTDRAVAIAEGFRQIGPDMPGMGEHWMQPGRMVSGRFRAAEPAVLTYVVIDGRPVLTGVAYVLPLQAGQEPPSFPEPHAWHAHGGTVDEELLVALGPHGMDAMRSSGVRLAMLHAWVFVDNPEGPFAADNWGLPFLRAGLVPPASPDRRAALALSLAAGGVRYYENLFRLTQAMSPADDTAVTVLLTDAEVAVRSVLESTAADDQATAAAQVKLAAIWVKLWNGLAAELSPAAHAAIARFGGFAH